MLGKLHQKSGIVYKNWYCLSLVVLPIATTDKPLLAEVTHIIQKTHLQNDSCSDKAECSPNETSFTGNHDKGNIPCSLFQARSQEAERCVDELDRKCLTPIRLARKGYSPPIDLSSVTQNKICYEMHKPRNGTSLFESHVFNPSIAQSLSTKNFNSQNTQPPSTEPLPEPVSPSHLPPPEDLLKFPPTSPLTPEQIPSGVVPETITVQKFQVIGSTIFSAKDFESVTQSYTKRPITLAELFQVSREITNLYVKKGYITSGAFLPLQKLHEGVVTIRVVEGKLEDVKVTGTRRLNSGYVRSRLATAIGKPVNRDRLLHALQLLQINPLIQNLSAELSVGSRPGVSLLEVKVKEAKTFTTSIILDNARSPSVGSFRRQVAVNEANLLGFGDSISAVYTNTDGSNTLDLNYTIPINSNNGTLAFNFGTSDNNVIERPFSALDIQSNSRYYELTLRQPIIQTPDKVLALGFTATRRESEASFFNGEIPFPEIGADAQGKTRITSVRFFQDWTLRNSQQVFALRSQFSFGLDALDSTINAKPPDSRFFAWRGQAQWLRLLAPDTVLLLRGNIQVADRPLVPFEQFSLGGIDSVRGYRQDALLTDNGFFASAEVRVPIIRFSQSNSLLQITPFVDFGTTWNVSDTPNSSLNRRFPNTLASVGFGLRLQLQDRLTARLDWGIPLIFFPGEKNTWQENGLYFSIIGNAF
ncbi:ShlB/FhaC/HecB family hemolysin secretion/activation protein [Aetokthonos hydrillicola Thurmond2011]|jgi:hemolysin activation/secretion protein|uniref:ShlB/FhaC/HecB family hemolysin secretion/activation protein n=2 Tax=Aetokthonos TaxID=1550243 RepID=A0AAP5I917_9CYAN|nr:ShlB/FhaC/HecB family hemolysin secretion/activation protein [Aetokthonos hydrillicola Thurmond2011]